MDQYLSLFFLISLGFTIPYFLYMTFSWFKVVYTGKSFQQDSFRAPKVLDHPNGRTLVNFDGIDRVFLSAGKYNPIFGVILMACLTIILWIIQIVCVWGVFEIQELVNDYSVLYYLLYVPIVCLIILPLGIYINKKRTESYNLKETLKS